SQNIERGEVRQRKMWIRGSFGVIGIIKKQYIWSGVGIICAIIGLLTSPMFLTIIGVSSAAAGAR
ncbi:hypothetical protein FWI21_07900, partial [Francisella tularensis subsp. holarctica]|nr:hypothetical protein [Francisella tularensis subsp. holarctica]